MEESQRYFHSDREEIGGAAGDPITRPWRRKQKAAALGFQLPPSSLALIFWLLALLGSAVEVSSSDQVRSPVLIKDLTGHFSTLSTTGSIDLGNPFFQPLGTNGRTCATCHAMADGWSLTPADAQASFKASKGADPLFRPLDGSNCPDSPGVNATPPAASAYSLLLSKGLLRIFLPVPSNAQFTIKVLSDPYGCALTEDANGTTYLSMYRRPLPATNLRFLSSVLFDGRATFKPLDDGMSFAANLNYDLAQQASTATVTHSQASAPPPASVVQQMVSFELATYTAQQVSNAIGNLNGGAGGGPAALSRQTYYPGINNSLGDDPGGAPFNPNVFSLFETWKSASALSAYSAIRQSIARGEQLFSSAPVIIQGVKGLNDTLGETTTVGTCSTCHDAPNVGTHSLPVLMDTGISDVPVNADGPLASALAQINRPRVPIYALTCTPSLGAPENVTIETSDPGGAMITGLCRDIGKLKSPTLRALASHPPYFHDGSADTLQQVVSFYDSRFKMGLTANEQADLVNFLNSL
ncbi:MAG TPA: hypothetical protein VFZ27_04705 [Terriglobia bacterium]|nr:hypothetical protein [Terriglobia bacterium]